MVIVSTHVAGSAHVNKGQTRFSMSSGSVNVIESFINGIVNMLSFNSMIMSAFTDVRDKIA